MSRRILITGASVAGNTAALSLGRRGFDVTVVERASGFRDGGQNVDVRGAGRDALRRMGLEGAALDRNTGEEGTAWIDADGRVAAEFRVDALGGDGPTAELEILRGDLARLLFEPAREVAEFRFGDGVAALDDAGERVAVSFASGRLEEFDAVVVAEGVGSSTRELVFPGRNRPRWMDMTIAYFTIPRVPDDDRMWRWFHAPGGRSVSLRPDPHGTTRAMLTVRKPPDGEHEWEPERQKAFLRERFADAGWQAPRVLAAMEASPDFYFDVLRQVRMPAWSKGRVVLTGDAAWCATPLAGIGTTLAVVGATVLAGEMSARSDDLPAAFAAYEAAMRPIVENGQGVPKIGPRLLNPQTRPGIAALHGALRLASRPTVRRLAARLFSRPPAGPDLSRYDGGPGAA